MYIDNTLAKCVANEIPFFRRPNQFHSTRTYALFNRFPSGSFDFLSLVARSQLTSGVLVVTYQQRELSEP